jgi:hypothetical protein
MELWPGNANLPIGAAQAANREIGVPRFEPIRAVPEVNFLKIIGAALILALTWTAILIFIARTVGLHSTPGMWTGAVGLPGVVIANWIQSQIFHRFYRPLGYSLMFLINWGFYCSVLQGIVSFKRRIWN